jgi:TetR/AcrR family transcriptional regulator, regulator of autoinduction and epiphytic fitness
MAAPVNPRRYDNSRREEAARRTRQAIVAAARDLFLDGGYAATTLAAIAQRAGVSVQTVYAQFGSKSHVLKVVVDHTVAGDDDPRPLAERESVDAITAEADPRRKLRLHADQAAEIMLRMAPVDRMIRSAAALDADAARQHDVGREQRRRAMGMLAEHFADAGLMRTDLTVDEVADRVATLIDPELYWLATAGRGLTHEAYAQWLYELMLVTVLGSGKVAPVRLS